jgi:hypothetical protein
MAGDNVIKKAVAGYLSSIFARCTERHGIEYKNYDYPVFALCPLVCAYPVQFFRSNSNTPESNSETLKPEFQAIVDAGRAYSAKLDEVTEFFLVADNVEFYDIPESATEELMTLADAYYNRFDVYRMAKRFALIGKFWNSIHSLEDAVVLDDSVDSPAMMARAADLVRRLFSTLPEVLGVEGVDLVNLKILEMHKKTALEVRDSMKNDTDSASRDRKMRIMNHARARILHYSSADALREFDAELFA